MYGIAAFHRPKYFVAGDGSRSEVLHSPNCLTITIHRSIVISLQHFQYLSILEATTNSLPHIYDPFRNYGSARLASNQVLEGQTRSFGSTETSP